MADQSLFCPACGARQLKPDARFCHVCGQPIPAAPVAQPPPPPPEPPRQAPLPSQGGGGGVGLWLLPLILVVAALAAALAWQPARSQLLALTGLSGRAAWTPSIEPVNGTPTPIPAVASAIATLGGAEATATAVETAAPPTPTALPTRVPLPSATSPAAARPPVQTATPPPPPPTSTPLPTSTPTATATPVTPTPVVGKIVFASDRNGYAHLFTVSGSGKGLRAITGGNQYFWDPVLSNDGTWLAYVSKVGDNTEVFVARSDGSGARPISNHPAEDDHPAWFPGNNELAFASRRDGAWEIYRMNADGSNVRRLTSGGGDNRFAAVSPDGQLIAYVAQGGAYPTIELMVMNADSSGAHTVLRYESAKQRDDPGRFVYRPDWSPDGSRIAFGADDDGDGRGSVLVVNVLDGSAFRLMEDGYCPAWSPDGTRMVYKPSGERQILFVTDAVTGGQLYQLTGSNYNAWSPDWAR